MKRFIKKNFMVLSGTLIFISLFMRFYLAINQIEIYTTSFISPVDFLNLLLTIVGLLLVITTFYYLPLLFLVKYHFNFTLRFQVQNYKESYLLKTYSTQLSKQNTFKLNNVIRC